MNIFELNVFASPVCGLIGGLAATKGMTVIPKILAGSLGVAVGVGLYVGVIGMGWLVAKVAGVEKPKNSRELEKTGTIMGIFVLLPMLGLPFLSAWAANALAANIFK